MTIKNKYFSLQKSLDNLNEYEIVFSPKGKLSYYSIIKPAEICAFFNIELEEYLIAAERCGAIIKRPEEYRFVKYTSPRFMIKKDARKFINGFLDTLVTAGILMGKLKK